MTESHDATQVAVVIEDEPDIRDLLVEVLRSAGFTTLTAANGTEGLELVRECEPLVTTLDIGMPGIDGFETVKRLREFSSTYVIMLTARTDEIDVLHSFASGADDYVTKPFRPRELRARIDAMLRRPRANHTTRASTSDPAPILFEHRGLNLSPEARRVTFAGTELDLTRSEFDLLYALMRSGARVCSKSELAEELRGGAFTGYFIGDHDRRAVEVHVANLRRKLGENANDPTWIETVRGVGYRLTQA